MKFEAGSLPYQRSLKYSALNSAQTPLVVVKVDFVKSVNELEIL
jgi:hypothetical protein